MTNDKQRDKLSNMLFVAECQYYDSEARGHIDKQAFIADYLLANGVIVHNMRDTDIKEEALRSCPFCGSENVVLRQGAIYNGAVHCLNCTADVVFDAVRLIEEEDYDWQSAVTRGWNNRVKDGAD